MFLIYKRYRNLKNNRINKIKAVDHAFTLAAVIASVDIPKMIKWLQISIFQITINIRLLKRLIKVVCQILNQKFTSKEEKHIK